MKTTLLCIALVAAAGAWAACVVTHVEDSSTLPQNELRPPALPLPAPPAMAPMAKESLGARIFADTSLSEPTGQACATCHDPNHAFADPRGTSTSEGAVKGRFGVRNAPSIVYASLLPSLAPGGDEAGYAGGQFWDGRVDTLQDQVKGPLLNPLEMNNTDARMLLAKIRASRYAPQFISLYGAHALDNADAALGYLADAISAYEASIPHRFSSKYDAYLAGGTSLTDAETRGLRLFEDEKTGPCTPNLDGTTSPPCGCAQCHLDRRQGDSPPMFTDFGYDNIGIPHNPSNPFYQLPADLNPDGPNAIDEGLGGVVHDRRQMGQFKAPSLRNVAVTAPYGHNGYFKTLKDVVHFYSTRDVAGAWFPPEHKRGMNLLALGNLRLTDQDENDIVSFLGTLTDGIERAP